MQTRRFLSLRTRLILSILPLLLLFMAFNFAVTLIHESRNLTRETENAPARWRPACPSCPPKPS